MGNEQLIFVLVLSYGQWLPARAQVLLRARQPAISICVNMDIPAHLPADGLFDLDVGFLNDRPPQRHIADIFGDKLGRSRPLR
jgi:hypothetical protein